jgi:chromosome segregation ATPase
MVYKEELDLNSINLKLNVLSERINLMEDFKRQIISAMNKITNNIIELKQKREKHEEMLTEIEKLKGKLEIVNDFKTQLSDTTKTFSEEIGELRTMILDREKSFSKIELGFEKINEIVKEIEPGAISKELEKKEAKITELESRIDKLEGFYNEMTKKTEELREFLSKIKSFENLVELSKKIKKSLADIEDSKNYVDRVSGKIEAIFEDVNEKVLDLDEKTRKMKKIEELVKEMVPTVDKMQIALENKADKKDVDSIKNIGVTGVLKNKIESMENEIKEIKKLRTYLEDIKNIKEKIEFLTPAEAKKRDEIKAQITSLEDEIEKMGEAFENKEVSEEDFEKYVKEREEKIRELTLELEEYEGKSLAGKIRDLEKEIAFIRENLQEENIERVINQMKELNKQMKAIEAFKEKIELMKPKSLGELISEKDKLSQELKLLSDQHKNGMIDRATFENLFDRKQRNLIQVISLIREKEKHGKVMEEIKKVHTSLSDFANLISLIKENSKNVKELKEEIKSIKEKKKEVEDEAVMKIKEVLDSLEIYEMPKNIKEIKENLQDLSKHLENELKFIQLTSALLYIEEESTVLSYIYKIKSITAELKSMERWDEDKEDYLKRLYSHLIKKYKDNKEIRDLYLSLI